MDELTIGDQKYLSSKKAAQITGYAKDYVGQLCREGRVEARLVGRNWYVLESSLLEHRFGPEEQKPVAPDRAELDSTWKSPVYGHEPLVSVPELAQKAVITTPEPSNQKVLVDMQSAWQEWFKNQENAEKALPEPNEMLLPVGDEVQVEESSQTVASVHEEYEPVINAISEPVSQDVEEIVHISRIKEPEMVEKVYQPVPVRMQEETVHIQRSHETYAEFVGNTRVVAREPVLRRREGARRSKRSSGGSFALKAVFISIAGLAIAIAVIGSGLADRYVREQAKDNAVTNFLGGERTIEYNK
ncbi:MAG: helix-turn-helix domain-containing protein [Patescibacteria group bacterium]